MEGNDTCIRHILELKMMTVLYSHNHDQLYKHIIHIHLHMHAESTTHNKDERHSLLEKYTSHFIWKVCVWERVGDQTELQHIDPHSIGHNRVSFPFSWAAQLEAWGPTLLGAGFLYRILSPTGLVSKQTDFLSSPSYIIVQRPPSSCGHHNCTHSTHRRSRLQYPDYSSTGCTCYLHRCISYFDSPAGS